jgi:hypothetical protein
MTQSTHTYTQTYRNTYSHTCTPTYRRACKASKTCMGGDHPFGAVTSLGSAFGAFGAVNLTRTNQRKHLPTNMTWSSDEPSRGPHYFFLEKTMGDLEIRQYVHKETQQIGEGFVRAFPFWKSSKVWSRVWRGKERCVSPSVPAAAHRPLRYCVQHLASAFCPAVPPPICRPRLPGAPKRACFRSWPHGAEGGAAEEHA